MRKSGHKSLWLAPKHWVIVQVDVNSCGVPGQAHGSETVSFVSLESALHAVRVGQCRRVSPLTNSLPLKGWVWSNSSLGKWHVPVGEQGKVTLGSAFGPDGCCYCMTKCAASRFSASRHYSALSVFLRKEGLSKCGRCKQAFYCNVECQVGVFGPAGREGLVPQHPSHPVTASQGPSAARAGKPPCGIGCGWMPLCAGTQDWWWWAASDGQ